MHLPHDTTNVRKMRLICNLKYVQIQRARTFPESLYLYAVYCMRLPLFYNNREIARGTNNNVISP